MHDANPHAPHPFQRHLRFTRVMRHHCFDEHRETCIEERVFLFCRGIMRDGECACECGEEVCEVRGERGCGEEMIVELT